MASSWLSKDTVAVVTGANRGIGLEIVRLLAKQGLTVVLTARDGAKGQAAADGLLEKGFTWVVFHELDAADPKSAENLASWLKSEYGGIDILINNAGVLPAAFDYESAKQVLDVNYHGVKAVTEALLPLLRPSPQGARIVQVTSRAGSYERLQSESLKEVFRGENNYTLELADSLAAQYLSDVESGQAASIWVPQEFGRIYAESKMFLNVYSSALAKSLAKSQMQGHEIFLAGMCPGPTLTDMSQKSIDSGRRRLSLKPMKAVEEGAETAVWLALLPKEEWKGKTGRLFAENKEYLFGRKNVPH